jgi:hypothetical protein
MVRTGLFCLRRISGVVSIKELNSERNEKDERYLM